MDEKFTTMFRIFTFTLHIYSICESIYIQLRINKFNPSNSKVKKNVVLIIDVFH